jgi:hypothetical protein
MSFLAFSVLNIFIAILLTAGCYSLGVHDVKPENIPTANERKEGSIRRIDFSFGSDLRLFPDTTQIVGLENISLTDDNGTSLIDAWREALLSSIAESQLFSNSDEIEYDIGVKITNIVHPKISLGISQISITAEYQVLKNDRPIMTEIIESTGRADRRKSNKWNRMQYSYRNAVRSNIELFITELLKDSDKL